MLTRNNTVILRLGLQISSVVIVALAMAGFAHAAKPGPIKFVTGENNRNGCLVCHGDPKILKTKTKSKEKKNLYIGEAMMFDSAHKELGCIDCHKDFTRFTSTKEHDVDILNYKAVARLSCANCHRHSKQVKQYSMSSHGKAVKQ